MRSLRDIREALCRHLAKQCTLSSTVVGADGFRVRTRDLRLSKDVEGPIAVGAMRE